MYEKILVPLDGSELAEVALPYAEELAARLGSEIRLTTVLTADGELAEGQYYHLHQFYIQQMSEATKRRAERYVEKPEGKEIKVKSAILIGHPAEKIVDFADKEDIGLIVMATHGRSGIKRWALGSVADKLLRATTRPVALIRAKGARPDLREKAILNMALVPLDGSKESEAVIPYIEKLASKLNTEVFLFHVVARVYHVYAAGEASAQIPYTDEEMESLKASAQDYVKKVAGELKDRGITAASDVRVGAAAEEIIRFAEEISADVVAMSTHGQSGIGRWVFGSIADKVLHGGNTPLLLVRTPGVSRD